MAESDGPPPILHMHQNIPDRTVQEYRTDFTPELRDLRISLTSRMMHQGRIVPYLVDDAGKEVKGHLCTKHFNEILPMVRMATTKAWTLSRVHEEKAEAYIASVADNIHGTLLRGAYFCPECGIEGDAVGVSNVGLMVEMFLYGNSMRGVGGFEAVNLSKMQQVSSIESYQREESKGPGLLRSFLSPKR